MKVSVQPSIDLHALSIFSFFQLFLLAEVLLQEGSVLSLVRGSCVVTLFIGVLNQKQNVFIPFFPIIYAMFLARSDNPDQCPSHLKSEQWSLVLLFVMKLSLILVSHNLHVAKNIKENKQSGSKYFICKRLQVHFKAHHNMLKTSKFSKCGRQLISFLLHPRGHRHFLNIIVILLDQKNLDVLLLHIEY